MSKPESQSVKRRGGRPSRIEAGKLEDKILDAAAAVFFHEGYGATSVEEISRRAQVSKRTLYARYDNKAALFSAVVHRIIQRLRPSGANATDHLFEGKSAAEVLRRIAPFILKASLSKESLALYRIVLAEAQRFPELALIMNEQGARQEAIHRISALLKPKANQKGAFDPSFAAEQFLFMLTAAPQRRALGLGTPMTVPELDQWASSTVDLFLKGWSL